MPYLLDTYHAAKLSLYCYRPRCSGKYKLELAKTASEQESVHWSSNNNVCGTAYLPPNHISAELLAERDEYLDDIRKWEIASTKLFSQIPLGTEDHIARSLLKIHVVFTKITSGVTFHITHPPELGYDAYLPGFTTIVTLAASIQPFLTSSPLTIACFHFDVGVLPGLEATASHCRNREIRGEAIRLLFNAPGYREGIWDSLSIGTITDWKRNIEEEFLDENRNVPGHRRCSVSMVDLNLQERKARVACKQWDGPEMMDYVTKETVLIW
jgi:hypothetical protein